jgi:hypothetical protein
MTDRERELEQHRRDRANAPPLTKGPTVRDIVMEAFSEQLDTLGAIPNGTILHGTNGVTHELLSDGCTLTTITVSVRIRHRA